MKTGMTTLEFLISLRPALPMSRERGCKEASNSEIRRWLRENSVVLNGTIVRVEDLVDFPVTSLIFFPKSAKNRSTLF